MKKFTTFLLMGFIGICLYGQDTRDKEQVMFRTWYDWNERIDVNYYDNIEYGVVRIGEYEWLDRNLSNRKSHSGWHAAHGKTYVYQEVDPSFQSQLDYYLKNMKLDKSKFQMSQLTEQNDAMRTLFTHHYGYYYHVQAIEGNRGQDGGWVSSMMTEIGKNISSVKNGVRTPEQDWTIPDKKAFQQLFAMCSFNPYNESSTISQVDVRFDLAPLNKSLDPANALAFDIGPDLAEGGQPGNHRTAWFEGYNTNRYGFKLMPGGGRTYGSETYGPGGYAKWQINRGDFVEMFHVAKFALLDPKGDYGLASLDIEDDLRFYPNPRTKNSISGGRLYNIRLCRPLTPKELDYELFYNNDDKNPSIKKEAWDAPAPAGYTVLEKGYLRGFYVQYVIEREKNPNKYTLKDLVKFSKCVDDPTLDTPDCDCKASRYVEDLEVLVSNLAIIHEDIESKKMNDHRVVRGQSFIVDVPVPSDYALDDVKIGLFEWGGEFIDRIDYQHNGTTYHCKAPFGTGEYFIQAYVGEPLKGSKEVKRLERNESKLFVINALPLSVDAPTYGTGVALKRHLEFDFFDKENEKINTEKRSYSDRSKFSVKEGEWFNIVFSPTMNPKDVKVGLFTKEGILKSSINTAMIKGAFRCNIPKGDGLGSGRNGYKEYIVMLYELDGAGNINLVSRQENSGSFIDRLPLNVIEAEGEEDWWLFSNRAVDEKEVGLEAHIQLYPNPVNRIFDISSNLDGLTIIQIEVFDLNGLRLKHVKGKNQVDVSNLKRGTYVAKIKTDRGVVSISFMKE